MMNSIGKHLERVIVRTIRVSELSGKDYTAQDQLAVRTVRQMEPTMTSSEALRMVEQVRSKHIDLARGVEPVGTS